jgi:hypothetical protein
MITVYFQRDDLIKKHKLLLEELKWINTSTSISKLMKAFPCIIYNRVMDGNGNLLPMTANIYLDNMLAATAFQNNMTRLLAAVNKAIFTVCGIPDLAV